MTRPLVIAAVLIFAALLPSAELTGDIVKKSSSDDLPVLSDAEALGISEVSVIDEVSVPPVSVPEPATFGIISLALAVGGGLLIRRKTDY